MVVTYFFMGKKRCETCTNLEKLTKQTVAKFRDRGVRYRFVDCDDETNKHYIEELKLESKSVVVSVFKDGQRADWSVLDMGEAFMLVAESKDKQFDDYLSAEINNMLGGGK